VYKACINEEFKSLFFPTILPYFTAETWSVDFLFLSRPHIFIKTSQCIKKLLSWYINNFSLIMTLQFLILQWITLHFLFLSKFPEEWCQDEFCIMVRICFFRNFRPNYTLWALTVFWTAWRFCNTNNCYFECWLSFLIHTKPHLRRIKVSVRNLYSTINIYHSAVYMALLTRDIFVQTFECILQWCILCKKCCVQMNKFHKCTETMYIIQDV
jgi:hypothetical protein